MSLLWLTISIGGGGSSGKSSSKDLTPWEYANQRGFVADTLRNTAEGGGPQIEGPFAVPVSGAEQFGLDKLQSNVFRKGGLGAAQDKFLMGAMDGGQQNPFLQETIDAATRSVMKNAELEELRDRALFTSGGQKLQGSSAFVEDRLRDIGNTQQQVGDIAARIAFEDHAPRVKAQLEAAALVSARFTEMRESISTLALPRLVEQYGLDAANEEAERRIAASENAIAALGNLSSPQGQIGQTSSSNSFNFGLADFGGG